MPHGREESEFGSGSRAAEAPNLSDPEDLSLRYPEIAKALAARIRRGEYAATLPSPAALAGEFEVSPGTMRRALEELERRAVVMRAGGRWSLPTTAITRVYDFSEPLTVWTIRAGIEQTARTVEMDAARATPHEARQLGILDSDRVVRVVRVVSLDGRPSIIGRVTLPDRLAAVVRSVPVDARSMLEQIFASGLVAEGRSTNQVGAIAANSQDADLLGVRRGAPLTRLLRTGYDADGRAFEHGEFRLLPDALELRVPAVDQTLSRSR